MLLPISSHKKIRMSGSFLEIDVDILLEFRSENLSQLKREIPVVCPVFIMPSKRR